MAAKQNAVRARVDVGELGFPMFESRRRTQSNPDQAGALRLKFSLVGAQILFPVVAVFPTNFPAFRLEMDSRRPPHLRKRANPVDNQPVLFARVKISAVVEKIIPVNV